MSLFTIQKYVEVVNLPPGGTTQDSQEDTFLLLLRIYPETTNAPESWHMDCYKCQKRKADVIRTPGLRLGPRGVSE